MSLKFWSSPGAMRRRRNASLATRTGNEAFSLTGYSATVSGGVQRDFAALRPGDTSSLRAITAWK